MRALIALSAALATAACGPTREAGFAATPPPPAIPSLPNHGKSHAYGNNGAIFQPATGYVALHRGNRAAKVGDIVSVLLVEQVRTSKSVRAKTQRDGDIGITPPSVGPFSFSPGAVNSGSGSAFDGTGNASQTSAINGEIAVTIAQVLPNGTARIRGEKLMELSRGEEWVQLSGLIRLADIGPANTIPSNRVADARIVYSGGGDIQRSSRPGWLGRFFQMASPF